MFLLAFSLGITMGIAGKMLEEAFICQNKLQDCKIKLKKEGM
jgi:hypothetical protein